jgi:hypothetical protein
MNLYQFCSHDCEIISKMSFRLFVLFLWWCLTPLTPIFQLYRGGQFFYWRKPEDPEKKYRQWDILYVTICTLLKIWHVIFSSVIFKPVNLLIGVTWIEQWTIMLIHELVSYVCSNENNAMRIHLQMMLIVQKTSLFWTRVIRIHGYIELR